MALSVSLPVCLFIYWSTQLTRNGLQLARAMSRPCRLAGCITVWIVLVLHAVQAFSQSAEFQRRPAVIRLRTGDVLPHDLPHRLAILQFKHINLLLDAEPVNVIL